MVAGACVSGPQLHLINTNISRGRWGFRQLSGFSVVVVIVALFVPNVCPVEGGFVGYIRKALERVCMLY